MRFPQVSSNATAVMGPITVGEAPHTRLAALRGTAVGFAT